MAKKELSQKLFTYFETNTEDRYELTDFYDYIGAMEYNENTDTYTVSKETALNWYMKDISNYNESATVDTLNYDLWLLDDEDTKEKNEIIKLLDEIRNVDN